MPKVLIVLFFLNWRYVIAERTWGKPGEKTNGLLQALHLENLANFGIQGEKFWRKCLKWCINNGLNYF